MIADQITASRAIIDAADALLPCLSADEAWLASVRLVEKLGGNALNVVEIEHGTGRPIWFRSSMNADWLGDYFAQDFLAIDPLVHSACQGNRHTRLRNGRGTIARGTCAQSHEFACQITNWGYHTLDFLTFASGNSATFRGLTFSHHDKGRMVTNTFEKTICAFIASVVTPPESKISPGATPWIKSYLSTREKDVLRYLTTGLRNDAIASKLNIAEITVRQHIASARRKLGAATREQAIALAIRSGQLAL